MKTLTYVWFAANVGSATLASANAFNVNEHDAKVAGRGGASVATNTEASSIAFNPGGIAVAAGTNFTLNGSLYIASGDYTLIGSDEDVDTTQLPAFAPSVFVTSRLGDTVAVGIGVYNPFGLAIRWPLNHPQAEIAQREVLRTYFITPTVGINLDEYVPGMSVGFGVDMVPATVELHRAIFVGEAEGRVHLGGDTVGLGGRVGVMYHPAPITELKLGVMWRSQVHLGFNGQGDFDIAAPFRSALPPDGAISTEINLPQQVNFGAAYSVTPDLEFELNVDWIDWSVFDELRIMLPGGTETVIPENYNDTWAYRVGAEYALRDYGAAVRAGFIYDPTPIPRETLTAQLPDINRKNLTIGGSKQFGPLWAHASVLWVTPGERETADTPFMPPFKGTYGVQAWVTSLSVSGTL